MAKQNSGKTKLSVTVDDPEHKMSLYMSSPEMSVDAKNFLDLLDKNPLVYQISLNSR